MGSSRIVIHLTNLRENFRKIRKSSGDSLICGAVKANAYGHGIIQISKVLEEEGCDYLAVARTYEVKEILNSGIKLPILVLTLQTPEELKELINSQVELIVTTLEYAQEISKLAKRIGITVNIHLKVDTGMGRVGCSLKEAPLLAREIQDIPNIFLKGLATHFSVSDCDDSEYNQLQIDRFNSVIDHLQKIGINPPVIHSYNSGAILNFNRKSQNSMIRAGLLIYGYYPSDLAKNRINVEPVLELESTVTGLKRVPKGSSISYGRTYTTSQDEIIANIPIGYADGFPRALSNRGEVTIGGKRFPIIGNICMDQLLVRVDSSVKLYDKVKLIGLNEGDPTPDSIAEKTGTISYEILTNLKRVKKEYIF